LNTHLHMALLVDGGRLVATVQRSDLEHEWPAHATGSTVGTLAGRVIAPDAPLAEALRILDRTGGRRLAVVGGEGELLGLLCLKPSRSGFCSKQDVSDHREDVRARAAIDVAD